MSSYFEESYRKNCRKEWTNYFHQKIVDTNYPPNLCAFTIKAFHFTIPYITYLIYMFAPIWFGVLSISIALFFLLLFNYFKGCIISTIEYKLHNDTINIIDPYLVIFGYPINDETRYSVTMYLVYLYFFISFLILYTRLKMRHFRKN